MIREINSSDWLAFCQQLSQQRAGATAKLEVQEPDGVKSELAGNATFQSLELDETGDCNDVMTLRLRDAREIVHEMIDPIRLMLHPSGGAGDFNQLQIEAENGVTFVTLHPPVHAQMLEGLKAN